MFLFVVICIVNNNIYNFGDIIVFYNVIDFVEYVKCDVCNCFIVGIIDCEE